jgi:uroporphyrinogen III methyltransferase/synthase
VVRLKGGDPFVFGRGGEEAEVLARAGVPFEVVPGVSSATGVPAYAGIPLTRRGLSSSFAVLTGHESPRGEEAERRRWLLRGADTVVVLMAARRLGEVVEEMLRAGRDPREPAAVIIRGSTPGQRVVRGALSEIPALCGGEGCPNPAVLVSGPTAGLASELDWFGKKPLLGRRIVVTLSPEVGGRLSALLREEGAEVVETPLIRILPPESWEELDGALGRLSSFRWLFFTSQHGVEFFFRRLRERRMDARTLSSLRIGVVGKATARALEREGLFADLVPPDFRAASLLSLLREEVRPGERALFPAGDLSREELPQGLETLGVEVERVTVYRTRLVDESPELVEAFSGGVDLAVFGSPSAVEAFLSLFGPRAREALGRSLLLAIGPTTARALEEAGLDPLLPEESTVEGLFRAILALMGPGRDRTA